MTIQKSITLEWLAGWIEGEGSFITKKTGINICGTSTDEDVLDSISSSFGGKVYTLTNRNVKWKQQYKWVLSGESAYELSLKLLPLLHTRRKIQASKLIEQYKNSPRVLKKQETDQLIEQVIGLRENGMLHREIAEMLNIDRTYVTHILRKIC